VFFEHRVFVLEDNKMFQAIGFISLGFIIGYLVGYDLAMQDIKEYK
jgi:hypothetical protein